MLAFLGSGLLTMLKNFSEVQFGKCCSFCSPCKRERTEDYFNSQEPILFFLKANFIPQGSCTMCSHFPMCKVGVNCYQIWFSRVSPPLCTGVNDCTWGRAWRMDFSDFFPHSPFHFFHASVCFFLPTNIWDFLFTSPPLSLHLCIVSELWLFI